MTDQQRPRLRKMPFSGSITPCLTSMVRTNGIAAYAAIARLMIEPSRMVPPDTLTDLTGMDSAAVSEALEGLVQIGLVTKTAEPDPETGEMVESWFLEGIPSPSD